MKKRLFIKSLAIASLAIVFTQGCSKEEDESLITTDETSYSVRPSFSSLDTRTESEIAAHTITGLQAEAVELNTLKATGKYAVVVGISDYDGWQYDLTYCDEDAEDWADLLEDKGFTVTSLIDGDATYSAIKSAVEDLASLSSSGSEIAFCYSGHGGSGSIISSDLNYIGNSWFKKTFSNATSTKMMFSFDACEIGDMDNLDADGRIIALASSSNTYSYDGDDTMKNGVFTYYQMVGYDNKGYIYVEDDSEYAVEQMESWARKYHITVGPSYVDSYDGDFELGAE